MASMVDEIILKPTNEKVLENDIKQSEVEDRAETLQKDAIQFEKKREKFKRLCFNNWKVSY